MIESQNKTNHANQSQQTLIRALHVVTRLSVGGMEKWLIDVLKQYNRSKFQMDVCCVGKRPNMGMLAEQARQLGSEIHYVSLKNPFLFLLQFRNLLLKRNYNVLINHIVPSTAVILAGKMARNPKIINMYHNAKLVVDVLPRPLRFTAPLLEKLSVSLSDVVIGCSETTLDGLFNGWREHQNYSALYLGIPLARFQQPIFPLKIKSALGIPNDSPVVGHIGRFAPQKNHEAFVLVAQTLVNKLNDFHFLLVGDGPLRNKIENQVDALGLSGNFHFTGIRHDIPDLISAMDLAFFPSLIEGSPVTFIEAQVAGLPVVTVDRPELREAICPENHTQLIVPIDEPELAANRIHQLLMNPSLLEVISRRGSQWATNRFSIEKSTIELENIINNAVAQS